MKFKINKSYSPMTWVHQLVEDSKSRSGGVVEHHLIGAKLERRFKTIDIPNHPAHAGAVKQLEQAILKYQK